MGFSPPSQRSTQRISPAKSRNAEPAPKQKSFGSFLQKRTFLSCFAFLPKILGKTGPIAEIESWDEEGRDGVQQFVQHLDRNGKFELFVPKLWSFYMGAQNCYSTSLKVYDFKGGTVDDVSRRFKGVYLARLQILNREIQTAFAKRVHNSQFWKDAQAKSVAEKALPGNGPTSRGHAVELTDDDVQGALEHDDLNVSCLTMERDRMKRVLGQEPLAGLKDAEAWAKSDNSAFRSNAATVLANIATPAALAELRKLAVDKDPNVAIPAKAYLEQRRQK